MNISGMLSPDEFWSRQDEGEHAIRRSFSEAPVYELVTWTGHRMISEWAFDAGTRSLLFGIPATVDDSDSCRVLVGSQVPNTEWQLAFAYNRASKPGATLETWMQGAQAKSIPAPGSAAFVVDGANVTFDVWTLTNTQTWWAIPRTGPAGILIEATGVNVAEVALQRALDIEPYIAGRSDLLHSMRGD